MNWIHISKGFISSNSIGGEGGGDVLIYESGIKMGVLWSGPSLKMGSLEWPVTEKTGDFGTKSNKET